jgi:phosphate-selective porin OprO/OprP
MARARLIAAPVLASALLVAGASAADDGFVVGKRGLSYRASDGNLRLELGGRLHLDAGAYDDGFGQFTQDARVRRARVELSGSLYKKLDFRLDFDVEGLSTGWRNAWVSVEPTDDVLVRAGNFIPPFSMEDLESSNTTLFMERALTSALAPGFLVGGAVSTHGRHWTAAAGYFADPLDAEADKRLSEGRGFVGRVTYAPISRNRHVLHAGLGVEYRTLDDASLFRLRAFPESTVSGVRFLDTGRLPAVDNFTNINLEGAYLRGPVSVQGAFTRMSTQRARLPEAAFNGWHTQASWVLTGERRQYSRSRGVFDGVESKRKWGALEAGLRYSTLDLSDQNVQGGVETNLTAGLNWYVNDNVRVMGNAVRAEAKADLAGVEQTANIGQIRLQLNF